MFALAFGWAVGCLCLAHLSLAASSANLTANAGPSLEAGSAADYDQPDGLKLLPDHPAGQATLHNLCMQVINSFPLSATTQFAGAAVAAIVSWAVYTRLSFTAARIWATQQHPPPGQGIAQRVARRASFLIYTWNASGLRTEVAAVLLLLSAFLYKEWWEGILAVLLCLHALRVWRGQELEQPPSVQRYHLLMAAHGVIGSVLTGTYVASCLAWLWSWVLPERWLSLLPGRLLRAAVIANFTAAGINPRRGFLADMGPLRELPGEVGEHKVPGAVLAYEIGPQFWWAASYPLATLLWRGHTWLPLLLVATCCGGWWAALLVQGKDMVADGGEGREGAFLWAQLSQLPSASQVLLSPWLHGGIVKGAPPPPLLIDYWRGRTSHEPSVLSLLLHPVAAVYQFLGCLPAALLSGLHLAPHWFPEYFIEVLALIAFQASVPFGALFLFYRGPLRPLAFLWWLISVPVVCLCAALLAHTDLCWLCASCVGLLNRLGMAPVTKAIKRSHRFIMSGVKSALLTGLSCCFAGVVMLPHASQVSLRWAGRCAAFLADALISASESWVSRAVTAVNTKVQGLLRPLDPRKLNAPAGQQRRVSGGYVDDGCLAMLQPGGKKAVSKQRSGTRKAGKAPAPASKAAASSPAATAPASKASESSPAAAVPASKAGQSSQNSDAPASKAGPCSPSATAAASARKNAAAATKPPEPPRSKERAAAAAAEALPEPSGKAADNFAQPPMPGQQSPLQSCMPTPLPAPAAQQGTAAGTPQTPTRTGDKQQGRQRRQQQRRQKQQRQPAQPTEPAAQLQPAAVLLSSQPSHSSSSNRLGLVAAASTASPKEAQVASMLAVPDTGAPSSSQPPPMLATLAAPPKPDPAAAPTVPMAASPASVVTAAAPAGAGVENLEDKECVLCLDHGVQCVLVPCGHLCLCLGCTRLLFGGDGSGRGGSCRECPMCRQQVQQWVKVHC